MLIMMFQKSCIFFPNKVRYEADDSQGRFPEESNRTESHCAAVSGEMFVHLAFILLSAAPFLLTSEMSSAQNALQIYSCYTFENMNRRV